MAVSVPVLERKLNTEDGINTVESRNTAMSDDEIHNSRIKMNYARLINPDSTVSDIINKEPQQQTPVEEPVIAQAPSLVDSARVESDIFRVNSAINQRQTQVEVAQEDEEENEDLRPSAETFKYKDGVATKVVIEDKISNKEVKASRLTKRDKVIMAVALLVIVALFILVIVNSAVLTNLNSEVSYLQNDLAVAEADYVEAQENLDNFWDNSEEMASNFAKRNGMIKNEGDNQN